MIFHFRIILLLSFFYLDTFNYPVFGKKKPDQKPNFVVDARFNTDSLSIGQHLKYILTIEYPRNYEAIIPDSTYNFMPFEHIKTFAYPTHSSKKISRDSIVYILTSFNLDSIQSLSIPVSFIDTQGETQTIHSDTVSLDFKSHLLAFVPLVVDIPATRSDIHISIIRDYQGWTIIIIFLGVIMFALGLYFRKPIYIYITEKRLKKGHQAFINKYETHINNFNNTPKEAELIVTLWKQYLEKLIKQPFTKYTQKDFKRHKNTSVIAPIMHNMEKLIYGNKPTDTLDSFKRLLFYANEQYEQRIIKLKAGKRII